MRPDHLAELPAELAELDAAEPDCAANDAATVAVLRGLERTGHLRPVLAELDAAELAEVFAAEDRHLTRRDARWAAESRAGRLPAELPAGYPVTFTRDGASSAAVILEHAPGAGAGGRDYLIQTGAGPNLWAARAELGPRIG